MGKGRNRLGTKRTEDKVRELPRPALRSELGRPGPADRDGTGHELSRSGPSSTATPELGPDVPPVGPVTASTRASFIAETLCLQLAPRPVAQRGHRELAAHAELLRACTAGPPRRDPPCPLGPPPGPDRASRAPAVIGIDREATEATVALLEGDVTSTLTRNHERFELADDVAREAAEHWLREGPHQESG
jgi:hypothetical protein